MHGFLLISSFIAAFPLYYMIVTALKSQAEFYENPLGIPRDPSLANLIKLVTEQNFLKYFSNTVFLTLLSTTIVIIISIFAAYGFARFDFRGKNLLFNFTIALTAIPIIIVAIPIYSLFVRFNLLNKIITVSFVYAGFMLPLTVFVLTSFFRATPKELFDAAVMDGCRDIDILFKIMVPMSKPAILTMFIVNGLWVWNELLLALLLLQQNSKRTVVVVLSSMQGRFTMNQPLIMAGSLFVGLPMIIVFILGQRYFIKGLTSGIVK